MSYSIIYYKGLANEHKVFFKDKECRIIHREDGPACEWKNGGKEWWVNGKRHRIDGPAIEYYNGNKSYWLNGKYYKEEEYWEEVAKTKFGGFV